MTESAPVAWQEINGRRVPVSASFALDGSESLIGFQVNDYDPHLPLTIDPSYLWHTFYGKSGAVAADDYAYSIAVDSDNNIYVTGYSLGNWYDAASPLHDYTLSRDIFILKLDSAGTYQWHTFYGGSGEDVGYGIALDDSGNIYVTGYSGAAWSGPDSESPKHAYTGNDDIFVLKLNSAGAYQWHTFYGSTNTNDDIGRSISIDGSGNLYVTGISPATWDGDGGTGPLHPHSNTGTYDIMVLKLDSAGAYGWHTFYGGSLSDGGYGVVVDASSLYVAGASGASWNGDDGASPLHPFTDFGSDITILKLSSAGAYQWHTFYGSADGIALGYGIALDGSGDLYVTGNSANTWNAGATDTIEPLHGHSGSGIDNMTVLKLDSDGAHVWHTFYGGSADPWGPAAAKAIAVNGSSVYVAGSSQATWNGDDDTAPLHPFAEGCDATMLALSSAGA